MNKRPLTFLFCFFLILIAISVPALGTQVSPEITQQPVNSYANAGSIISTSVTAVGDDLQYQWYIKNPGQSQFGKSSMTGPAYTLIMTESMSGRQIYCIVSDKYGNTVQTDTVTLKIPTELAIEKQPANQYVADGEPATASVLAAGDELQYTWYLKAPGQEQFRASSVTDSTYSATMSAAISGQQLYCVISDCHGNSVTSDTVTQKIATPIKIIHQPSNVYADIGKTASTYVVAQGDDLIYQWYIKNPGQEAFAKSSMTGDTYSVNMTEQISGRQIRCVITDHLGRVLISDTVTLEFPPAICVLQHPANSYAFPGESVTTSVKAEGEVLQYHWYLKEPGQTQFSETPVTENTYRTDMTEEMAGSQLYCLITDQKGNQTQTNTATLWTNGVFRKDLEKVKPGSTKNLAANLTFHTANLLHWKSSDPAIASVDALGTVTGMQYGTVTITATDSVTGREAQCSVKVCDVKQVALTFDDGPSPQTKRLLDFLRENNIPVTFFVVFDKIIVSTTIAKHSCKPHRMAMRWPTTPILTKTRPGFPTLKFSLISKNPMIC